MDPRLKEQSEKLNAMKMEQMAQATKRYQTGLGASIGDAECAEQVTKDPELSGIRDRVAHRLDRAWRESRKADRLQELAMLLQKNPEVARILDLIEETR